VLAAFGEFVQASTPPGLTATVTVQPAVRPSHSPITSPAVLAGRRAMERAFDREVLFTGEGGSGPEADLAEILAAPLVFVATGLDADQIHAPNEAIDVDRLLRGAEASAYLWPELAAAGSELG
jgi:acetylornithine deacetylase/succinyl-diaminopimelate desuccinylase-like protein